MTFWFHERDMWVFYADPIISGQHCLPTHILRAPPPSWWSFLGLAGASLLPPRGALGLRVRLEVEPPFVCDQDCLSARAPQVCIISLEILSFQSEDQRLFD